MLKSGTLNLELSMRNLLVDSRIFKIVDVSIDNPAIEESLNNGRITCDY